MQLFKAMTGVRGSAFVEPEWVVMHPTDYQAGLLKDTAGQYFGGGPWMGQYGAHHRSARPVRSLAAGFAVGQDRACLHRGRFGNRARRILGRRNGVEPRCPKVEVTNSHSDFFTKDLVAIRAERRLALTVFRPGAFCEVRLA